MENLDRGVTTGGVRGGANFVVTGRFGIVTFILLIVHID